MVFAIMLMNVLLGIGNEMNGDDAIGVWIARNFRHKNWLAIDCATVPENYIGEIVRQHPEKIVMVDAAQMNLKPGEVRIIPKEKISKATFSTHTIPLSLFMGHLKELTKSKIYLIGIQPKVLYGKMSNEAKKAGERVIQYIKNDEIEKIKVLE